MSNKISAEMDGKNLLSDGAALEMSAIRGGSPSGP